MSEREYVGPSLSHLHRHLSVIDEDLPRKEIGTNRCLVACAELLVDLFALEDHVRTTADAHDATDCVGLGPTNTANIRAREWEISRTYWFIKLVLPTPLSPRMMT